MAGRKRKPASAGAPELIIVRAFTHDGITYGTGEDVPALDAASIERYLAEGALKRITGPAAAPMATGPDSGPIPETAKDYLSWNDQVVLRKIRTHTPDKALIAAILALAASRSDILREALALAYELKED